MKVTRTTRTSRTLHHDPVRDWGYATTVLLCVFAVVCAVVAYVVLPRGEVVVDAPPAPPVPVADRDFTTVITSYSTRLQQFQSGTFPFLKLPDPGPRGR